MRSPGRPINSSNRIHATRTFRRAATRIGLLLALTQSGWTQQVVATIPLSTAGEPWAVAVNPVTDKIYVAGGVGGGILMVIVGLIKQAMGGQKAV